MLTVYTSTHTPSYVHAHTHLLCRHGGRWRPVRHRWSWSGHGASCSGWTGLGPWSHLAGAEGSFPSRNTPLFGRSASSWPAAGAGQWGETPVDTGLSPCYDERHYIAGNNLVKKKQIKMKWCRCTKLNANIMHYLLAFGTNWWISENIAEHNVYCTGLITHAQIIKPKRCLLHLQKNLCLNIPVIVLCAYMYAGMSASAYLL